MVSKAISLAEGWFQHARLCLPLLPDVTTICLQYVDTIDAYFEKQLFAQVWANAAILPTSILAHKNHPLVHTWLKSVHDLHGWSDEPNHIDWVFICGGSKFCHRVACYLKACSCGDPIYPPT